MAEHCRHSHEIAWEKEVWCVELPDHNNGDKFFVLLSDENP